MNAQLARLQLRDSGAFVVAEIAGEIDMSNADDLGRTMSGRLTNDSAGLIVDLSAVTYLDSAAIHTIYELRERLTSRALVLRLVVPPDAPTLLALRLTGVPDAVALFDTVAAAEAG
ncbi:MAG TPA: STAS domain-containing protein [Solirubrobacteraceae bacterium]|jgi:anti-anti-sigma factor